MNYSEYCERGLYQAKLVFVKETKYNFCLEWKEMLLKEKYDRKQWKLEKIKTNEHLNISFFKGTKCCRISMSFYSGGNWLTI